uniref:ID590 n=1 Tax=Bradyrhizobium japonicum TaxID=375 RepID=Q9AN34_BRAJP|nr:ID590 [Bradyrhizobium japonicum]
MTRSKTTARRNRHSPLQFTGRAKSRFEGIALVKCPEISEWGASFREADEPRPNAWFDVENAVEF